MLAEDVVRRPACHALALLALAEAVGEYKQAVEVLYRLPRGAEFGAARVEAQRAEDAMLAKYAALEG